MKNLAKNRREFTRYPTQGEAARVTSGADTFDALVFDESIGGLCLVLRGRPQLSVGDEVEVDLRDEQQTAYVRSAQKIKDNRSRLGLSWAPPSPDEIPVTKPESSSKGGDSSSRTCDTTADTEEFKILEQVYYQHGPISLVCEVVGISECGQVKIRLHDGRSFLANCRKIATRNRAQRIIELSSSETRQALAAIYGTDSTHEAILEFEFS